MKEYLEIIGGLLGILVVLFVLELVVDPAQAQVHADVLISTFSHIYHSVTAAFH
jgi:hypothetical protein